MSFRFILPESRPHLTTPAGEGNARPAGDPRRQLRRDYERLSRILVGALALLVLAPFGLVATLGVPLMPGRMMAIDIVMAVIGAVALAAALWLLVKLHRSGRRILIALSWWSREPHLSGAATRAAGGWVRARTVNFEPRIFTRIVAASLIGLLGIFGLSAIAFPGSADNPAFAAVMISWGAVCVLTAAGQMGGVMHLISGIAEQDPLWVRIRGAFRRS
ncbi:hypothetical protein [Microbacterium esteraromaticum]|uniref:hypothetical protein n=1 Tax=Microbacterium esteraromaticum TaxID=57043 RepID=UPI001C94A45B|nr:hypothetical protein [Microbacterium esteraromaticum]MBY6061590.1 hypothetical protein [Microbacterium esteraromaticum]